jgi:rRNA maturation endonuclease Nob1
MKKSKKQENLDPDEIEFDDKAILEESDDIDIIDIDDPEEDPLDETTLEGVDIEEEDDDIENIDDINEQKDINLSSISDIKVVKCPNCKEDVLEAELCPICGKKLKTIVTINNEDFGEGEEVTNSDFFDGEDNYIPEGIDDKIEEDYYE